MIQLFVKDSDRVRLQMERNEQIIAFFSYKHQSIKSSVVITIFKDVLEKFV